MEDETPIQRLGVPIEIHELKRIYTLPTCCTLRLKLEDALYIHVARHRIRFDLN